MLKNQNLIPIKMISDSRACTNFFIVKSNQFRLDGSKVLPLHEAVSNLHIDTARNMKSPNFILLNSSQQKNLFSHSAIFLVWQSKIFNQRQSLVCTGKC